MRRAGNEGTVTQRADGRWEARLSLGTGPDGKRQRRTVYGTTRREVVAKLRELQRSAEDGTLTAPRAGQARMDDVLDRYAAALDARVVGDDLSAGTRDWYVGLVRTHVRPVLGSRRVVDVTASDIERLLVAVQGGMALRRGVYLTIRQALDVAVRDRLIPRNPAADVRGPRVRRTTVTAATADDLDLLVKAADEPWRTAIVVLGWTGLRRAELLGLRWADLDLDEGVLHVHENVTRTSAGLRSGRTKTDASRRTVPLVDEAIVALRAHARSCRPGPFVFSSETGGPVEPRNFSRAFDLVAKRAGVDASPHRLRHGLATRLANARVSPAVIASVLGHADMRTLSVYLHSDSTTERAALEALRSSA